MAKAGHTEGGRYKPQAGSQMASPNVIPMADIMLVLLIIFMVVTPMLQKTKPVDLARTNTARDMQDADKDDSIVVAVTRDGNIFLGNTQVAKADLSGQVKDRIANKNDKTVFLKSDARAKYGDVVAIVDEIRSAGVDQLGLLTERNERAGLPPRPPADRGGAVTIRSGFHGDASAPTRRIATAPVLRRVGGLVPETSRRWGPADGLQVLSMFCLQALALRGDSQWGCK